MLRLEHIDEQPMDLRIRDQIDDVVDEMVARCEIKGSDARGVSGIASLRRISGCTRRINTSS